MPDDDLHLPRLPSSTEIALIYLVRAIYFRMGVLAPTSHGRVKPIVNSFRSVAGHQRPRQGSHSEKQRLGALDWIGFGFGLASRATFHSRQGSDGTLGAEILAPVCDSYAKSQLTLSRDHQVVLQ